MRMLSTETKRGVGELLQGRGQPASEEQRRVIFAALVETVEGFAGVRL